jgi:hypothetical protein
MPVLTALKNPLQGIGTLLNFGAKHLRDRLTTPDVPVRSRSLRRPAAELGRRVRDFHLAVLAMMRKHREELLFRQYVQERIADAACELYASACVLSRLDHLLTVSNGHAGEVERDVQVGKYYLKLSDRKVRQCLAALNENDDGETTRTADAVLGRG